MTNEELKALKDLYEQEKRKRRRILQLTKVCDVREFLELTGNDYLLDEENLCLFSTEPSDIFKYILRNGKRIELSGSSNIYVVDSDIDNYKGRKKKYFNLESYDSDPYVIVKTDSEIEEFEYNHDIINNKSMPFMNDGVRKVQTNFFLESFKNGEAEAKKKILTKYGNLKLTNK